MRPDPPSEARYLGRGWGRDGGQGSGKRAQRRQGQLQQGKLPRRREDSVGKGKTPPAPSGGRGEKPGSGKRNRQGEGDLARPTNSRERALGPRDSLASSKRPASAASEGGVGGA